MNDKNSEFLKQFDKGAANPPAPPEPFQSQPLGYRTPDGKFVETGKPAKK